MFYNMFFHFVDFKTISHAPKNNVWRHGYVNLLLRDLISDFLNVCTGYPRTSSVVYLDIVPSRCHRVLGGSY